MCSWGAFEPPTGEVVIPAEIAGRPVVGITAEAFAGSDTITGMTVRLAVEGIAEGLLPDVPLCVIVENDEQVVPDAIAANVCKVLFADGVTRIADNWFTRGAMGASRPTGCQNLETFDIAESVVRIGTNVFEAACALEPSVQNGLKIYQGWCLGFAAAEGGPLVHVTMPDGVRGIAARAFEGEYDIETVAFPSTLRFVGAGAFKDCTGLEDINLPEGVAVVDREAFRNCTYAQSLILSTTLEEIGNGPFVVDFHAPIATMTASFCSLRDLIVKSLPNFTLLTSLTPAFSMMAISLSRTSLGSLYWGMP